MSRLNGTLSRGVVAGLLGASALALWFLAVDAIRAEPFATPTFVARALIGLAEAEPGPVLLAMYTAFHFMVFILVGVIVAWVVEKASIPPHGLLGLVLGFLLFDLIFYAGVLITGTNVVQELGWPAVLAGNLIAGYVLMRYLYMTAEGPKTSVKDMMREHRTIREGLVAGLLGAVAVMIWFFVLDLFGESAFHTPGALGSALFFGARGMAEIQVTVETVLGYTGIHIVAFMAVGLIASAMVEAARREPPVLLGMVLFFVTLEVLFIGLLAIVATWLLDSIQWWMVVVGNLIAAAVMGGYLLHEHPELRENLAHDLEEELV
ncbi:MAG TPA: hypothetical protein VMM79_10520 [Longimicrobiales bacterium]|nr:hypothetical protein [Longimicrobiales bacterium]